MRRTKSYVSEPSDLAAIGEVIKAWAIVLAIPAGIAFLVWAW